MRDWDTLGKFREGSMSDSRQVDIKGRNRASIMILNSQVTKVIGAVSLNIFFFPLMIQISC